MFLSPSVLAGWEDESKIEDFHKDEKSLGEGKEEEGRDERCKVLLVLCTERPTNRQN